MTTMRDPDFVIGAWLASGPTVLPPDTRTAIVARLAATGQRRPMRVWPARWSSADTAAAMTSAAGDRLGLRRVERSRFRRTVLVLVLIGALVALLVAIAVGGGSLRGDRAASPSPNPSCVAVAVCRQPARVGSRPTLFRSETSIGTIEWTRVESASADLPVG